MEGHPNAFGGANMEPSVPAVANQGHPRRKPTYIPDDPLPAAARSAAERGRALSTFWRDVRAGRVPPAYYVSPRCPRWRRSELRAALEHAACQRPATLGARSRRMIIPNRPPECCRTASAVRSSHRRRERRWLRARIHHRDWMHFDRVLAWEMLPPSLRWVLEDRGDVSWQSDG
jgi:predicted DNA-binding transcriptional regulator AlpA